MISHVLKHDYKKPPKIKPRVIIIAILIILILAAVTFSLTFNKKTDTQNQAQTSQNQNSNPSSQTQQPASSPPPTSSPASNPQPTPQPQPQPQTQKPAPPAPVYPTISTSELQSIMQSFSQVMSIKDPKIRMQFHDDNSLYLGYTYFIGSGGQVSQFSNQAYDMWLTINVYDALNLKASSDKCAYLKSTIQSGRAWVIEQSSNPFVIMKYLPIKNCVK